VSSSASYAPIKARKLKAGELGRAVELSSSLLPVSSRSPGRDRDAAAAAAVADADDATWWLGPQLFAVSGDGDYVVSGGHWDHTVKITSLDTGRVVQSLESHNDVVTCVAMATLQRPLPAIVTLIRSTGMRRAASSEGDASAVAVMDVLVTGSRDATVRVWYVYGGCATPTPMHVLHGHDDAVTSVSVAPSFGLVVSGSSDGTAICFSLLKGEYIRTIAPCQTWTTALAADGSSVAGATAQVASEKVGWVGISAIGVIAVYSYSARETFLRTYTCVGGVRTCCCSVWARPCRVIVRPCVVFHAVACGAA
jgi:WD40 repeat protein